MSEEEQLTPPEEQPSQEQPPEEPSTEPTDETPPPEKKPEQEEPSKEEPPKTGEEEPKKVKIDENDVEGSLAKVGFNYAELQEEFAANGDLTKETREKLMAIGITEEAINAHIEGQKAKAEKELDEISEEIGGREALKETIEWAAKNLDRDEIESINAVRDKNVMKILLRDLRSRMDEKEGKLPQYTQGSATPPAQDLFESQAQMIEAVRDPRYARDPAYRDKVAKKIRASREAGMDLRI